MENRRWYRVRSPEGYLALEFAYTPSDACRRAAESRPGYAPAQMCRAEIYVTDSAQRAARAGLEQARRRLQ